MRPLIGYMELMVTLVSVAQARFQINTSLSPSRTYVGLTAASVFGVSARIDRCDIEDGKQQIVLSHSSWRNGFWFDVLTLKPDADPPKIRILQ